MPFYFIIITLLEDIKPPERKQRKRVVAGVKENRSAQIEQVFKFYLKKYEAHYGKSMVKFNCVMISRQSDIYQQYWENKKLKILGPQNSYEDIINDPPFPGAEIELKAEPNRAGKYRSKKETGPTVTLGQKAEMAKEVEKMKRKMREDRKRG